MPGFGVASVFGALFGAFAAALAMGRFRLATFSDTGDTLRNLLGAALMGIGGVMALGCTVGQAITGVSTLALGSFLTFAAIVAGGFWGLRVLERDHGLGVTPRHAARDEHDRVREPSTCGPHAFVQCARSACPSAATAIARRDDVMSSALAPPMLIGALPHGHAPALAAPRHR